MTTTTAAPTTTTAASTLPTDLGLLVLRLALGLTMAVHGSQKLFGWFDGAGIDRTAKFFESQGYPASKAAAILAGICEGFGGLALAIGLLTPLAAAAVLGTMLNAISVRWGGGFFAPKGVEYEVLIIASIVTIALAGPGRFAVDSVVGFLRPYRLVYGLASIALALITAGVVLLVRN
ncbi:DoxX family protein [Nocardia sp. bgisy118]|uniref:DoxX family protein n=1 Tax=Nocardia sp. bgisy118 TaxID=3413786 RepID=UPI003F4A1963